MYEVADASAEGQAGSQMERIAWNVGNGGRPSECSLV